MSGVALLFILLIGLMMASVPVGISLGLSTLVTMVLTTNLDVITIPQYCFRGLDSFPLMAIPFFMLAGNLMKFGGLSEKLINLSNSLTRYRNYTNRSCLIINHTNCCFIRNDSRNGISSSVSRNSNHIKTYRTNTCHGL